MPANIPFAREAVSSASRTAPWVIAVLLALIAGILLGRGNGERVALAQTSPLAGGRGVFAFTGQIDDNQYGLFMLDIEQGTIWCYEIDNVGGVRKLKLYAARSWLYDRYLREFNIAGYTPQEIKDLVAKQRSQPDDADDRNAKDKDAPGKDDPKSSVKKDPKP